MKHFQPTVVSPQGARMTFGSLLNGGGLIGGFILARRSPDQRYLGIHPVAVQQIDIGDDRILVIFPRITRVNSVDVEPTVLVEKHAHDVDVPGRDRPDRSGVVGAVEDAPALHAGVLGARAIHALQMHDVTAAVH
jgi:hypothetical protein